MAKQNSWNVPFLTYPSWASIFNKDAPLELEIGMGRSHFLFERAKTAANHNIIGIEWKGEWVHQAQRKATRENIKNIHSLWGNAWELVPHIFEDNSLSQIIINFPDPWWKKKHHKRKILNDSFVNILVAKLNNNGRIYFQTDVEELFLEYVAIMQEHPHLKNVANSDFRLEHNPLGARSHREKKCEELGLPIYRTWFAKV